MTKTKKKKPLDEVKEALADVGRVGSEFIDGEMCRLAYQPYADKFMTGDDMDFNPEICVPLKKTLLRLGRISKVPCSVTLWRTRDDFPGCQESLLYGSLSSPDNEGKPPPRRYKPPEMSREVARAFNEGKTSWRTSTTHPGIDRIMNLTALEPYKVGVKKATLVQHYVPVKDSMGDIAAVLEVFAVAT
jgi:hypothetical protein